jgi:hypothetical protein
MADKLKYFAQRIQLPGFGDLVVLVQSLSICLFVSPVITRLVIQAHNVRFEVNEKHSFAFCFHKQAMHNTRNSLVDRVLSAIATIEIA